MTQRHLTILTGASRGMGLAMARQLLAAGHDLLCLSRKPDDSLTAEAARLGRHLEQWPQDLARSDGAAARMDTWLEAKGQQGLASVNLVNNAGIIPRIAPLEDIPLTDLRDALRVDLEAPMLLANAFLSATAAWTVRRRILNISSGLGRRAMASQAVYCAGKAGMDMFSRCVALEQATLPNGARICSLAPGVIDTDMQVHLRGADADLFPDRGNFVGMKERGVLSSPEEAAARVLAYLDREDFGSNPVADVRDPG
jgi:NAD(P)-dependent dehydrogenase (short-subunit alcohol dehydrogenase family)